jgi:hypothetical protein
MNISEYCFSGDLSSPRLIIELWLILVQCVDVQRLASEMAPRHGVQASEMWDVSDGIAIDIFIICC